MQYIDPDQYPKNFCYYNQRLHLIMDQIVKGLEFNVEEYAPMLQYQENGTLKYIDVPRMISSGYLRIRMATQFQNTNV